MATHNSRPSTQNPQSIARIQSAPAPEAIRALVWDAEAATQQWLERAPADIRTLAHFAQIGREWLTQCDHTDSPATRDYFECSVTEAMPEAQAALTQRAGKQGAPYVAVPPGYPLYFLRMMEDAAREALSEWLRANAPAEIVALFQGMETFECLQEMPNFCTLEESAHCIRDIAIAKKMLGLSEWPDFITTQPDEAANGMEVAG